MLDDILSLVEDFGLPVERESVGGREFVSVPLGLFDPGFEGYDLGYFIDDGMLAIGSTRGSLERVGAAGRSATPTGSIASPASCPTNSPPSCTSTSRA